jgi:hypothetical protein
VVVVAQYREHAVRGPQFGEGADQQRGEVGGRVEWGAGHEVARDHREVRPMLVGELHDASQALRRHPTIQVHVADLQDPIPVEGGCNMGQGQRDALDHYPLGLDPARVKEAA